MALWLLRARGINAGRIQMTFDVIILGISALFLPLDKALLSGLSAVATSGVLIAFHRPGRYIGH